MKQGPEAPQATEEPADTAASMGGDAAAGKEVFVRAGCGSCHTLEAAGAAGQTAPNLDEATPSFARVVERVTDGGIGMPSFRSQLSEKEIRDVAAFVSEGT